MGPRSFSMGFSLVLRRKNSSFSQSMSPPSIIAKKLFCPTPYRYCIEISGLWTNPKFLCVLEFLRSRASSGRQLVLRQLDLDFWVTSYRACAIVTPASVSKIASVAPALTWPNFVAKGGPCLYLNGFTNSMKNT